MYLTAMAGDAGNAGVLELPPRLLELLRVVGQHLYHNVAGRGSCSACVRPLGLV